MSERVRLCASILGAAAFEVMLFGCGSSASDSSANSTPTLPTAGTAAATVTSTATAIGGTQSTGVATNTATGGTTTTTTKPTGTAGKKTTQAGGAGGTGAPKGGSGSGAGGGNATTPNTGPEDGDPSKPMVSIDGVKCGPANIMALQSVKITNRDVYIAYPCAHEGAPVTFFLFLHGTVPGSGLQQAMFTMGAWPIHTLVDSHNIIVVTPTTAATTTYQWGNQDNGQDLPHLYEVVDWVYTTFGSKFDIRSMWAQGGSWGAFYLWSTFACDAKFKDRLKGVQMAVGPGCPGCSDRLSCIVAQEELEKGGGNPVSDDQKEQLSSGAQIENYANMHGCDPKGPMTDLGNAKSWEWANCDKGWTHSYILGPGQHADAWDPVVVKKTTEDIKATEK
jgi:hypothetical protein